MPAATSAAELRPQFSLAALLLVLAGLAIIGNTIVGGLPDKLIALATKKSAAPSQGGLGGTGVAGLGGAGASTAQPGTAPGSKLGPGVLGGGLGGPTQVGGPGAGQVT